MDKNKDCINTIDAGSIWGKRSEWAEVNKIAKGGKGPVEYLGNFLTYDDDHVYAVFHTEEVNYIIKID